MNDLLLITAGFVKICLSNGYLLGIIIAVLILGYLIYSLIKPENF